MRILFSKIALAATLGFALALTFSCSGDDGNSDGQSSQSVDNLSSSGIAPSSSDIAYISSSSLSSSSNSQAIVPVHGEPITDSRDGQTYETVVIGNQTWIAKNLNFETATGSKCYNDNTLNCTLYGRLYDWETAMNACPAGWHLPSDFEWVVLEDFIGGNVEDVWKKLTAKDTEGYGFNAILGGMYIDGKFSNNIYNGRWWTATENGTNGAYCRDQSGNPSPGVLGISKSHMYSVRCLKGDKYLPPSSPSYTPVSCNNFTEGYFCDDRDGKSYKSVIIDGKTWMAENLKYNASGSKCYGESGEVSVQTSLTSGYYEKITTEEIQENCTKYGKLYDWSTVMAFEPACNRADCSSYIAEKHKGICPLGWHVPSKTEWRELMNFAGGTATAGQVLKATSGWFYIDTDYSGADLLGFSALPGGGFSASIGGGDSYYSGMGYISEWWAGTGSRDGGTGFKIVFLSLVGEEAYTDSFKKTELLSLRCVKD